MSVGYAISARENLSGTKRETANSQRIGVLTRFGQALKIGGFLPLRPDGGVVTQRTANPLSLADFRDSSQLSPSVPRIAFQGLSAWSANT